MRCRVVRLYACNARTLTHLYYLARHAEQSAAAVATSLPFGSVTVRALLQRSHLRVEVLNARHLRPVDVLSRLINGEARTWSNKLHVGRTNLVCISLLFN